MTTEELNTLKWMWTDKFVKLAVSTGKLARFDSITGRVVTVNANGACLVDFQDGGWYDIAPSELTIQPDQIAAAAHFQGKKNSAQKSPIRQG
jgi:hypothetical protein